MELAKLSPKQFAHVARMYDVGAADDDCRPGGARAVRPAPAFVADLLARPELPVAGGESSPVQAREETPNESATGAIALYDNDLTLPLRLPNRLPKVVSSRRIGKANRQRRLPNRLPDSPACRESVRRIGNSADAGRRVCVGT